MKKFTRFFAVLLAVMVMFTSFPMNAEAATIKLNKSKTTIYVGKTETLKITGTKKKATWESSDKKVATVSQKGKVTAKKKGTATITAKVGKKTYKCKVTVKNPYINKKSLIMVVGQTYNLKLVGTEIKSVEKDRKYKLDVTKKGKVTAKKAWGTTVVTLKGKNGKSYECRVTTYPKGYEKLTKLKDGGKFTVKEDAGTRTYYNWNGYIVRKDTNKLADYTKCERKACYADYNEIVTYGNYIGVKVKEDASINPYDLINAYKEKHGYVRVVGTRDSFAENSTDIFVCEKIEKRED